MLIPYKNHPNYHLLLPTYCLVRWLAWLKDGFMSMTELNMIMTVTKFNMIMTVTKLAMSPLVIVMSRNLHLEWTIILQKQMFFPLILRIQFGYMICSQRETFDWIAQKKHFLHCSVWYRLFLMNIRCIKFLKILHYITHNIIKKAGEWQIENIKLLDF